MRLFVAVLFSPQFTEAVTDVQNQLRAACRGGNFTRRENLHLTLAFIGETPRLAEAKAALDSVKAFPFRVALERTGSFGDVFWVGTRRDSDMDALAEKVRNALRGAGFHIDSKPFRPHVTVARELVCEEKPDVSVPKASAFVTEFVLMRSDRVNGRLVYTPVKRFPLLTKN